MQTIYNEVDWYLKTQSINAEARSQTRELKQLWFVMMQEKKQTDNQITESVEITESVKFFNFTEKQWKQWNRLLGECVAPNAKKGVALIVLVCCFKSSWQSSSSQDLLLKLHYLLLIWSDILLKMPTHRKARHKFKRKLDDYSLAFVNLNTEKSPRSSISPFQGYIHLCSNVGERSFHRVYNMRFKIIGI